MIDNSRLPPIRKAFNRATDRRSEQRYEIYLRDIQGTVRLDLQESTDRKAGLSRWRD